MEKLLNPDRRTYLGSHDIGAIVEADGSFGTLPFVYASKMGFLEDDPNLPPLWWGRELEEKIIQRWILESGVVDKSVLRNNETYFHTEYPFIGATPDGFYIDDGGKRTSLDAKAVGSYGRGKEFGEAGTDQVPGYLIVQAAWHCICAQTSKCMFIIMKPYDGWALSTYIVEPSDSLMGKLIDSAVYFWTTHVTPQVPPLMDYSDICRVIIEKTWGKDRGGDYILADDDDMEQLRQIQNHNDQKKEHEKAAKTLRNQLTAKLEKNVGYMNESGDTIAQVSKAGSLLLKKKLWEE